MIMCKDLEREFFKNISPTESRFVIFYLILEYRWFFIFSKLNLVLRLNTIKNYIYKFDLSFKGHQHQSTTEKRKMKDVRGKISNGFYRLCLCHYIATIIHSKWHQITHKNVKMALERAYQLLRC